MVELEQFYYPALTYENHEQEVDLLLDKLDEPWQDLLNRRCSGRRKEDLVELFLQLGRRPHAIFDDGKKKELVFLTDEACCERKHLDHFMESFEWKERLRTCNSKRTGIPGTLHRISIITKGEGTGTVVIGVIARIGRSLKGVVPRMCPWLVNMRMMRIKAHDGRPQTRDGETMSLCGKSVLLIGRPGVGKTTVLRELAYALSTVSDTSTKTVVVVDKTNEIAGDAEVPHQCIGNSRWMPCGNPDLQPQIMREAVENASPDIVMVDEISNAAEVESARTVSERGVSLIATVHGNLVTDILHCRVRHMLVGGTHSITLSDSMATQRADKRKTVLERLRLPIFDVAVELHERDRWIMHCDVKKSVDCFLNGEPVDAVELRPGSSKAIVGIPTGDGLNYCFECAQGTCREHSTAGATEFVSSGPTPSHAFRQQSQQSATSAQANLQPMRYISGRVQRSGACRACGLFGHFARDCPTRARC